MKNYFSNSMVQILENAMEEVICDENSTTLKNNRSQEKCTSEKTIEEIVEMFKDSGQLETQYGKKGALGIVTKIGQASHRYFFRLNGIEYNLNNMEYRLMNSKKRYLFGLEQIAKFVSENSHWEASIINNPDNWVWLVNEDSDHRILNEVWGAFFNGFISEYLLWTSGGRFFVINSELQKYENSNKYQITILKKPLGN